MFSNDINSYLNAKYEIDRLIMLIEIQKWVNLDPDDKEYLQALTKKVAKNYIDKWGDEVEWISENV